MLEGLWDIECLENFLGKENAIIFCDVFYSLMDKSLHLAYIVFCKCFMYLDKTILFVLQRLEVSIVAN